MVGNEGVNSIFKIGPNSNDFQNDYKDAVMFLKELEKKRKNPFNLCRMKHTFFSLMIFLTTKTNTFETARKVYRFIKRN